MGERKTLREKFEEENNRYYGLNEMKEKIEEYAMLLIKYGKNEMKIEFSEKSPEYSEHTYNSKSIDIKYSKVNRDKIVRKVEIKDMVKNWLEKEGLETKDYTSYITVKLF